MSLFLAFLGVAAVVIITPGPDTAMTIRNTLLGGRAGGVSTALGIATGQVVWALATSIGLVALLIASEPVFQALKYAGAAYLVYLGVQCLREAFRPGAASETAGGAPTPRPLAPLAAFRQGVISDLGNPKMAVFFASLLPQFVPAGEATFLALLGLGLVFAVMTFAWLSAYAISIARLGAALRRSAVHRSVQGVTGTVLIGLGLRMAGEQR
jgi:threonine/homoserine/homoserine lactone efflux protein